MSTTRRKNSEKRKEKSRYAARARRSRESEIFTEMSALLPLHQTIDKASTMRLAISLIRTRNLVEKVNFGIKHDKLPYNLNDNFGPIDSFLIDAFLIVLTSDGHIPYISENVEKYLGLKQVDLLGTTIFEFSHPCDHNEILDALAHKFTAIPSPFLIRIKCTITNKGKTINLKSAAYKVIKLTGHWIGDEVCGYLCLVAEPLTCPAKIDGPISDQIFLSRHSPDMKFTDIDERFTKILGYEQEDLIGKSVYNLFHTLDCLNLLDCFKTLFDKGQSETGYYRLLAKRGGYIWIQTQATLITDNLTQQPSSVVCVNYALSGIENQEEIISEEQCQERQKESYHLVDKTNDVLIKLAASTLIDTNTDTGQHITATTISDNNSNTSNRIQNSRIDTAQQHRQQQTTNNNNQQQFIRSLSDYQLPSGILIDTPENLLNPLDIDQSTSFSCFSQVNSFVNQEDREQQQQYQQQHCQQQQQLQQFEDQPCSQGQLIDHQNQIEQSVPLQPLPSTPFLFTPLAGNSLPTPATATIFAPRTADMNPGFLMPIGDDDNDLGLTVLPDIEACDPEQDLTHLAPQAGDCCVPLEIDPLPSFDGFSMDDILKEMGFVTGSNNNRHEINESSSPLHNDPFLSFTNGLGGLVSDNSLCSLSSSSSSSSSPSDFLVSSSRLTSSSPDFTLTSGSINNNSHQLNTKRPSSLCDSPPPSSCNSTLTSDLDLCGSFAPDDEDEFDSLGGRSGCGRSDQPKRHYDDEFPLLPNDESIWDTFIHSNDINDMINSDELLSSPSTHFPIDDDRLISVTKDNTVKSSSSSTSSSTATAIPTPITTNNSISSSPSSLSSSPNGNNFSNGGSDESNETNNDNDGANDSFLLNSNLAMLLQGKDRSFKNCYTLSNGANCNDKQTIESTPSQYQHSVVAMAAATASRDRFHNYSANLPKTPSSTAPCSSSSTSTSSSVDNSRINSNYVIVQKNRSTMKTSSNHSNGTKDITKSAQNNLQNCDMSRNEIDRKSDYFTLDSEMKKYRTMADSVYSKLGPSYVKIARKLAYNSSSSSSSSSSMPSPKRAYLPSKSSMENNYKRMKLPSTLPSMQGTSVLMNLLVNGEDVTNGYSRFQQQSHLKSSSINVNIG